MFTSTNDWSREMQEQLEAFCEQENIYRFDSDAGVANLTKILRTIGYGSKRSYESDEQVLHNFLSDNSGAIEAIVNWIGEQNVPEWKEKLDEATDLVEDDDLFGEEDE